MHNDKLLGVCLILCPLILLSSPLRLMAYLAIGSWTDDCARYEFIVVEFDLGPTRNLLVASIMFSS